MLQQRTFENNNVRLQLVRNEIMFCAKDVGVVLGLKDVQRQVGRLSANNKGATVSLPLKTRGGVQSTLFIDEKMLYRLIFRSNKEEAERFQDWVFDEVLPSIRKTGKYEIPQALRQQSIAARNNLTEAWANSGVEKPHHFINLTKQEYKSLGFEKGKKKKDLTKSEIVALRALEAMEELALLYNPKNGYYECKDSLIETGKKVISQTVKKEVE